MQDPDTYIEANYSGDNWQATLFSRISPNDFQSFTERLPELRFDLFPTSIAPGLLYQGSISFAKLRKRFSNPIAANNETNRADAYYGFRYTKPLAKGVAISTKAGLKAVHYFDNLIENDSGAQPWFESYGFAPLSIIDDFVHIRPRPSIKEGTRAYGDFGFDLKFTAYRQSEYKNETWNIDGLRHIFEPVISYRYTPDLDSNSVHALQDTPAFSNHHRRTPHFSNRSAQSHPNERRRIRFARLSSIRFRDRLLDRRLRPGGRFLRSLFGY
jgi:LPS-assembly protein